jgi:hypothetical protein
MILNYFETMNELFDVVNNKNIFFIKKSIIISLFYFM